MPVPDVTKNYIRMRQNNPSKYSKMRIIILSGGQGIKAILGVLPGGGTEIQSYLFEKEKWSVEKAREWISNHKTDSFFDAILIEKIKKLQRNNVAFNDSIDFEVFQKTENDAWEDTPEGTIFRDVVFAKEMVQEYSEGRAYKPALEIKKSLPSYRGKPVVAYVHPPEKVVRNLKQQVGHIIFESPKFDENGKRAYGDILVYKYHKAFIEAMKKKRIEDTSIGFHAMLEKSPGIFNGVPYDYVQKDHFIDHLAVVWRGRASSKDGVGINAY